MSENHPFEVNLILLIEDNQLDVFIHHRMMELTRFARETKVCSSADEALDYLKNTEQLPDVIFLDLHMEGKNGFQFLDEVAELKASSVPTLMLTSSIDPDDQARLMKYNQVFGFYSKPIRPELLSDIAVKLKTRN